MKFGSLLSSLSEMLGGKTASKLPLGSTKEKEQDGILGPIMDFSVEEKPFLILSSDEIERIGRELHFRNIDIKGDATAASIAMIDAMDRYVSALIANLPINDRWEPSRYDWGPRPINQWDFVPKKAIRDNDSYTREASEIERKFRSMANSKAVNELLDDEALWAQANQKYKAFTKSDRLCDQHNLDEEKCFYSDKEIQIIEDSFKKLVGDSISETIRLEDLRWIEEVSGDFVKDKPNPIFDCQLLAAKLSSQWSYETILKLHQDNYAQEDSKSNKNSLLHSSPLSITADTPWISNLIIDANGRIQNRLRRNYIPQIKKYIVDEGQKGTSWGKIANGLRERFIFHVRWDWLQLIRTEIALCQSAATLLECERNLIHFVLWDSVMDPSTCNVCRENHGRRFDVSFLKSSTEGGEWRDDYPSIPNHQGCRCVPIPTWVQRKQAPRPPLQRITGT